jgi:hypothetical protein
MQLRPNLLIGHNDPLRRIRSASTRYGSPALPHKEPKLWLYADGIAVGFALGVGLALLFIR